MTTRAEVFNRAFGRPVWKFVAQCGGYYVWRRWLPSSRGGSYWYCERECREFWR